MDVCLHYNNDQENVNDVKFVTERILADFPSRVLPVFQPWFPSGADRCLPIKPERAAPVVLLEQTNICLPQRSELDSLLHGVDQEKIEVSCKRKLSTSTEAVDEDRQPINSVKQKCQRSWSVFSHKIKTTESTQTFSTQFQKTVVRFGLHFHQRAKLIICEANCVPRSVEDVWARLNHAIKHSRLPTCNANFQRKLGQIWVYCDILYCEYIGNFLKQTVQVSGEITLAVHKLGEIFKL